MQARVRPPALRLNRRDLGDDRPSGTIADAMCLRHVLLQQCGLPDTRRTG